MQLFLCKTVGNQREYVPGNPATNRGNTMISKIFSYIVKFIIHPTKAAEEIADDNLGLWAGFWWIVLFCFGYSITVFIGYMLGHTPATSTLLSIPLEKWYLVQTFTTIPVGLAGALSYSGLAYIFCKATFASQAFTLHIPNVILMWIPETLLLPIQHAMGINTIPWPQWIEILRVFIIPFPWIFFLSTVALSKIHKISWWKSLIIILVSSIPTAMIMAVFIR
jgi:hypothetical protein